MFAAPNQIIGHAEEPVAAGCTAYTLLIHPDFLQRHPLTKAIKQYGFFSYSANEALHLSDAEKTTIFSIFHIIEAELAARIDEFSQDIVIAQIELLLAYANRFYKRQFITRKAVNHDLLERLDTLLDHYFDDNKSLLQGLPSVHFLAGQLHVSPSYLSDMLRTLTGQNTQQHIHGKLIERAKDLLATTQLTVSEVAYQLGFEHSQSFSKLFKLKTQLSPLAFRQSFN
jgi:AraC-like DNA-binding protein